MTLFVLIVAVIAVTVSSVVFIRSTEHRKSDQLLLLLCETGEKNLDYYFNSVQKSLTKVASYVEADIDGVDDEHLAGHMERVGKYFDEMANKTNGVLTYYYRIDPEVSTTVKGFWFTNLDGEGFTEHVVTDITLYDTADTSALVWFTVPKHEGVPIWIPPYITDNLDWRVISYNVPIYYRGQFVGVIGIEIDYSTMAEQVDSIRLYSNGYAFLNDAEGNLFYHPRLDVASLTEETMPETPEGLISDSTFVRYTFDGEEKAAAWLPLSNGMRLTVSVPVSETGGDWQKLIVNICIVGAEVLLAAFIISMLYTRRITRPLEQLTEAANQADMGSYDYQLTYDEDDELGRLTRTFKKMSGHMKDHISDLSSQVFIDSLTNVRNKGAFTSYLDELQEQIDDNKEAPVFAIGVFDCDNLKLINDWYGHSNGDIYLKTASRAICRVFQHSPVFRIGGDEFAVILQNDDYYNREQLVGRFKQESAEISEAAKNKWEQVQVAVGVAEYEPQYDRTATDVLHRADKAMYENKRKRKKAAAAADNNYMRI